MNNLISPVQSRLRAHPLQQVEVLEKDSLFGYFRYLPTHLPTIGIQIIHIRFETGTY